MRRFLTAAIIALAAPAALAGYVEVLRADAAGDLAAAREEALSVIAGDPGSASAAACAVWWQRRLEYLEAPAAPLALDLVGAGPALRAVLAEVEAELERRPPAGTLAAAELSGPFGALDTLDIERGVVPPDGALPPQGPPPAPGAPWRLELRFLDGWIAPPRAILRPGVYLAAWWVEVPGSVEGWVVVEADAAVNVELDGREALRLRPVRRLDPSLAWIEVQLPAGVHRLRVAMASRAVPRVRVRLLDGSGRPLRVRAAGPGGAPGAPAAVRPGLPPVEAALRRRLEAEGGSPEDLLAAAALAEHRGDWVAARRLLERAAAGPEGALARLELAELYLDRPTGADAVTDRRRAAAALEGVSEGARVWLLRHRLAAAEGREEDAERALDRALETAPEDARVLALALERAAKRGWSREVEANLERLGAVLGASPFADEHRLEALGVLGRLPERNRLLERLAATDPLRPGLVGRLLAAALLDAADGVLERVTHRTGDLDAAIERARLALRRGRPERARELLAGLRGRWGDVPQLLQLELVAAEQAGDGARAAVLLERLLARVPGDLGLRTLAWARGRPPFFERYRRDPIPLLERARREAPGQDADAVLVLDQAVERVFPDGTSVHYYHGVTLALTPEGARQAAELNLLPDAELLTVRVIHPDGTSEVPASLSPEPGAVLTEVEPGDAVEAEYVAVIPAASAVGGGHLSPYVYRFADAESAFGLSEYVLLVPEGLEVEVEGNLAEVEVSRRREGDLEVVAYRVEDAPPRPSEPFAPPEQELLPWVTYGFGVTWEEVGDLMRDRVLAALAASPELRGWAEERLRGASAREALASAVADLMDRVRAGDRDLDLGTTAGAAFSRGEGDRLGILLAALVEQGWEVDLVLTRPRPYAGTHLRVPTTAVFAVPVARVRRGGEEVWVDLAEGVRGVDHVRPQYQGSDGLVLPLDDPVRPSRYLERLPVFPNPDLEERVELEGEVAPDGSARLTLRLALRGPRSLRLLEAVRELPEERVRTVYARVAASLFSGAREVEGRVEEREGRPPLLVLRFALDRACELTGTVAECRPLVLAQPLSPVLASLPARRYPLVLDLPVVRRYLLDLRLPEGWVPVAGPRRLEAAFGAVREELTSEPGRWRSELELEVPAVTVAPQRYPEFARFCHAVDELVGRPPRFRTGRLY